VIIQAEDTKKRKRDEKDEDEDDEELEEEIIVEPIPLSLRKITGSYENDLVFDRLHTFLLPHLNPLQFEYIVHDLPHNASPEFWMSQDLSTLPFLRLKVLKLRGFVPFMNGQHLVGLPSPTRDRRRIVRLHLPSLLYDQYPDVASLVETLSQWEEVFGLEDMQKGSMVMVIQTEKEKREVTTSLGQVKKRWRSLFQVELEC